jgi:UDP-N-acetylglucosamine diphosphorylase/glucosamine-1-phosphate N-acetyltransferase
MDAIIVEEEHPENFFPLTHTRATFELRYGAWCPLDRALAEAEKRGLKVALRCRPILEEYLRAKTGLPVNEDIDGEKCNGLPAQTPWEILARSNDLITADWEEWNQTQPPSRRILPRGVHLIGSRSDVYLAPNAVIQPGCVLDVSGGPIIIADGAHIKFSQITGPVFVGTNCVIDGARLRPGTSLGPHCKVGGEVSASVFQSRVNKAHDGFVGHSWAGRWVNFGAMATTSNLKNTYGNIRYQQSENTTLETGVQFLGSLIGDHTKIGIGQLLSTGSNIGVGCNIFGGPVAPKYIPSFCWVDPKNAEEYRIEKCLETVRATLARRNAKLRPASAALLEHLFADSQDERSHFIAQRNTQKYF